MDRFKRAFSLVIILMVFICTAGAEPIGSLVELTPEPTEILMEELEDPDDPYANDVIIPDDEDEQAESLGALQDIEQGPEIFSLLLIGTDGYSNKINGRSDSMMLCRLNSQTKKIQIVSFMRDLFVKIPGKGKTRLNAAFVYGGAALLEETLYTNFGVSADAYVAVNFAIMKDLVDQLGGVDIKVTKSEMNQINRWMADYYRRSGKKASYQKLKEYGDVHLDGDQALAFSRIRNIDSDYERTRRQRDVIAGVFKTAMSRSKLDLLGLVMNNIGKVQTDVTLDDALALAPLVLDAKDWEIETFRIPAEKTYSSENISGMSVLVPNLDKNRAALEKFFKGE